MTIPRDIPSDLNVELLLSWLPKGTWRVKMKGLHGRNISHDIGDIEENDGTLHVGITRKSLYNALPEYLFHPIDRFYNLLPPEKKERFAEELEKQKQEKAHAYRFFAPMDVQLLLYRMEVRDRLQPYVECNRVLIDIITDRLTDSQRSNRFIRHAIPFLPQCKSIRGNRTLLTLLLRNIFMEEGLRIGVERREQTFTDAEPQYADGLNGELGDSYLGNVYDEQVSTYTVHYWSDEACDENFLTFVDDVECLRLFLQDYFLSVEETLRFDITKNTPPLRLNDAERYNYLNYNTNI